MNQLWTIAITVMSGVGLMFTSTVAAQENKDEVNWFGGPVYNGSPALEVTAALVDAGGGPEKFEFSKALVSMLGEETVNAEVKKLTEQYGEESVTNFIKGMTFAVHTGLQKATEAGVKLPAVPADLKGKKLAEALVDAGTTPDKTWWSGYLFDKTLSHPIHKQVMMVIDAKFSRTADANTHRILNQAMYDVAQALGQKQVKLAPFN